MYFCLLSTWSWCVLSFIFAASCANIGRREHQNYDWKSTDQAKRNASRSNVVEGVDAILLRQLTSHSESPPTVSTSATFSTHLATNPRLSNLTEVRLRRPVAHRLCNASAALAHLRQRVSHRSSTCTNSDYTIFCFAALSVPSIHVRVCAFHRNLL
jgi:hypothetical protein